MTYTAHPGPDWQLLARRIVLGTLLLTAVLLALGMVLSYAGLRSAYIGAGFVNWAASAAPLCVDLLTLVGYVALLVLAGKLYPAAVVAFGVLASAGAQGYHQSHGGVDATITSGWIVFALGASCVVFAGLAGHLAWKILERALPADFISAMRGATTSLYAEPQVSASLPVPKREEAPALPADPFPDMGKLLVDYNNDLVNHTDRRMPSRAVIHRPRQVTARTGQPSQATGPCAEGCRHHPEPVSKSARYRCLATLEGRSDACPSCKTTREAGNG